MLKKQRAEHANEEIDPIGWLRVTHGRSQEERWRLNVEELKRQIKSSSEKFRRLHCLHLIFHAFLRAHTRITMRISAFLPSHSNRYHPLIIAWKIRGTSGMITWDPDAPKKFCRTVTDFEQSTQKNMAHGRVSVLQRKYCSTLAEVLEYSRGSTRVLP